MYRDGHGHCYACKYHKFVDKEEDFLTNQYTYEFLPWRGVEKETFRFYDCKTKIDSDGEPISIGFKWPNDCFMVRDLHKKKDGIYTVGEIGKAGLFGRDKFAAGSHKYVTITEGALDACSAYQVLHHPCVSVRSSSSAQSDCAVDRSWLNSFERIYLAFDGDEPGRNAADAVAKLFDYNKVYNLRFPGGTRKDANDFLQAGEADELRNIHLNAKKYLPATVVSDFASFEKILNEVKQKGIPYPWPTLNLMTYGIRTGESVLITAPPGIGKTEICHAIEHQILKETSANVGAIYIEEPKKRHLQAIAGIELKAPVHLPDSSVSNSEVFKALQEVVRTDDRLHLYSHFGSDDPNTILDTIRFLVSARDCRYIILDHITMVVSGLGGRDATTALDYLSTRLEMMLKELDFALIVVSHVNDEGSTRGSRNIAFVADIRIDATRDLISPDPIVRCTTKLNISKNRFAWRTGPAGDLLFDPITYTLNEWTGEPDALSGGVTALVA